MAFILMSRVWGNVFMGISGAYEFASRVLHRGAIQRVLG
jgi:hypothetical protein